MCMWQSSLIHCHPDHITNPLQLDLHFLFSSTDDKNTQEQDEDEEGSSVSKSKSLHLFVGGIIDNIHNLKYSVLIHTY